MRSSRPGIAALDPTNGFPLAGTPGVHSGVGVFDLLATPTGLWMGSDSDYTNSQYHAKIAFFPLAGGTVVPTTHTGSAAWQRVPGRQVSRLGAFPPVVSVSTAPRLARRLRCPAAVSPGARSVAPSMINDTLYTGQADGTFAARSFDGTTFGTPTVLADFDAAEDAVRLPHRPSDDVRDVLLQRPALLHQDRYEPVVLPLLQPLERARERPGVQRGANAGTGADWSRVAGMFQAGGKIYYSSTTDGALRSISFVNGQAVPGTIQVVSGPAIDGIDWRTRGMFLLPTNSAPTAAFTSDCTVATCAFDAPREHRS